MFTASLSLAAKDTPRRGKNIRVCLLSRGGEEMKKRMAVPKTPVFCTECLRKRVAYTRNPSTVPRVHSVHQEALSGTECYIGKKEKDLACAEFLKLPEKRRSSSARKEKAIAKSAARNAAASKKITAKKFAMPPQSYSIPPKKVDITPLSTSKKPISKTDRRSGSG